MQVADQLKVLARRILRGTNGQLAGAEFTAPDWDTYPIDLRRPFLAVEPVSRERRVVQAALQGLHGAGILGGTAYDEDRYQAMCTALEAAFEIPWSAISPRTRRLLYAINAIRRPSCMVAAGVFCGYTFICNAGAAVGPGAVYTARSLVGIEIAPDEAARAERNVRRIDASGTARIVAADAVSYCADALDPIDLLYLDAEAPRRDGRSIYQAITEAAWDKLPPGALLVAHNSVNARTEYADYLAFVRDPRHCRASINVVIDGEGLEVSLK
jgi:predicted O-methyltransferase YrrM